jgi:hypothetical protein
MTRKVRVDVPSHSLTRWADAKGVCPFAYACSRIRRVEGDNRAVGGAHKAVRHKVRVEVLSRRRAARIRALAKRVRPSGTWRVIKSSSLVNQQAERHQVLAPAPRRSCG